jgi:hypothetical protein
MANYPFTGSTTVGASYTSNGQNGSKNVTSVGLSTQILIKTGEGTPVGAIQTLNIREQSTTTQIYEVGTDGSIDSVRSGPVKISGSCKRIVFDKMRLLEAFGRGYMHIKSMAYPVDIWVYDRQASNPNDWVVDILKNVWFNGLTTDYSSDNYILSQSAEWSAEDISSILIGTNGPAAKGGRRGESILYNSGLTDVATNTEIERATDAGMANRRGALDVSGLIDLGYR